MAKRLFGVVVLVALMAGCGSVSRTIEPDPILPPPSDRIPLPGSYVAAGKVNCTLSPVVVDSSIPAEMEQFSQAMYCAYTETGPASSDWIRRFVEKGISLSDQTCGLFFNSLEKRRVDTSYYQTNMNVAGTALTAILVGAGHHARSAFNVATALTLGNAWFENYKASYVFTPQLGKLYSKLKTDVRKPIGDEMKKLATYNGYATFDQAKGDLQSYDELCTHKYIVNLLDDVLAAAKIETYSSEPSEADKAQAKVLTATLFGMATDSGTAGTFSSGQLEQLYVIASTPDAANRKLVADYIVSVDDKMKGYITKLKLDNAAAPDANAIATILSIGQFLRYGDSVAVRQYRYLANKAIEEQAARKAVAKPTTPGLEAMPTSVVMSQDEKANWQAAAPLNSHTTARSAGVNFKARVVPAGR